MLDLRSPAMGAADLLPGSCVWQLREEMELPVLIKRGAHSRAAAQVSQLRRFHCVFTSLVRLVSQLLGAACKRHSCAFQAVGLKVCVCVCVCVCVFPCTQSCLTLCNPLDCNPSGFSVCGLSQARILEWTAISFSGDLANPRIEPMSLVSPALAGRFFTAEPPGKPELKVGDLVFLIQVAIV